MLEQLLEQIVKELVDDPSTVRVVQTQADGTIGYLVYVAPECLGQVIGKQGRIADAIRTLAKAVAKKKRIAVDFTAVLPGEEPKS